MRQEHMACKWQSWDLNLSSWRRSHSQLGSRASFIKAICSRQKRPTFPQGRARPGSWLGDGRDSTSGARARQQWWQLRAGLGFSSLSTPSQHLPCTVKGLFSAPWKVLSPHSLPKLPCIKTLPLPGVRGAVRGQDCPMGRPQPRHTFLSASWQPRPSPGSGEGQWSWAEIKTEGDQG